MRSEPTFQRERLVDIAGQLPPLVRQHWLEVDPHQDIPVEPEIEAYLAMEDAGLYRLYTVRVDGALAGYAAFFVRFHPHYRHSLQATHDVVFLLLEHRTGLTGFKLLAFADAELAAEGVQLVHQSVRVGHDHGPLLLRLGYDVAEMVYTKRLDV